MPATSCSFFLDCHQSPSFPPRPAPPPRRAPGRDDTVLNTEPQCATHSVGESMSRKTSASRRPKATPIPSHHTAATRSPSVLAHATSNPTRYVTTTACITHIDNPTRNAQRCRTRAMQQPNERHATSHVTATVTRAPLARRTNRDDGNDFRQWHMDHRRTNTRCVNTHTSR